MREFYGLEDTSSREGKPKRFILVCCGYDNDERKPSFHCVDAIGFSGLATLSAFMVEKTICNWRKTAGAKVLKFQTAIELCEWAFKHEYYSRR